MSFSSSFSSGRQSSFLNYDELVARDLNPGDLIEIDRGTYNHWAMFSNRCDNGTYWCFHVTTVDGDFEKKGALLSSARNALAGIKKHKLRDIIEDNDSKKPSQARINNKIEEAKRKKCLPLPIDKVIQNLEKLKDEPVGYNLKSLNCEHYATNWKYGAGWSRQVELATTFAIAGIAGITATTFVGMIIYSIFGGASKATKYEDDYDDDSDSD